MLSPMWIQLDVWFDCKGSVVPAKPKEDRDHHDWQDTCSVVKLKKQTFQIKKKLQEAQTLPNMPTEQKIALQTKGESLEGRRAVWRT